MSQAHPTPKVSIGMPLYNAEQFVLEAIESILTQTFCDFELIISDNCSTDHTVEICRNIALRDPRIRLIERSKNHGAIDNFNFVYQATSGEYFKWAASDDLLAPKYLEAMVKVLELNPDVGWCHCKSDMIDQFGESWLPRLDADDPLTESSQGKLWWKGHPRLHHGHALASRRFKGVLTGTTWSVDSYGLIRRNLLEKTRMLIPVYGSEKVLLAEMSLYAKSFHVDELLFFQRVHVGASGAMTNQVKKQNFAKTGSRKSQLSVRLSLVHAHLFSVVRSNLSVGQKLAGGFAIVSYLLQIKKLIRVVLSLTGIRKQRSDGADMMDRARTIQTNLQSRQANTPDE